MKSNQQDTFHTRSERAYMAGPCRCDHLLHDNRTYVPEYLYNNTCECVFTASFGPRTGPSTEKRTERRPNVDVVIEHLSQETEIGGVVYGEVKPRNFLEKDYAQV
jgi:hypothetical protein